MTAPISPILQRILDFAPLLNAPPPPACLRCAADVWARLQALDSGPGQADLFPGPVDRLTGVPVVVEPDADPGSWQLMDVDGGVIASGVMPAGRMPYVGRFDGPDVDRS